MRKQIRASAVLGLVVMLFITLVAASPATLPAPGKPTVTATANGGELSVAWRGSQGAQFYLVGWANHEEVAQMTNSGRAWLDAFHFTTIPSQYTGHEIAGLKPDTAYVVIIGAQSARFGSQDLTWSDWSQPTTTAGRHGAGFCPITGLPIPEGGYLEVGDTHDWPEASFRLDSATSPATVVSFDRDRSPQPGDRYLRLCGTAHNKTVIIMAFLPGYDNNLSTDSGLAFLTSSDEPNWVNFGLFGPGVTASACDIWIVPAEATTAVYAVDGPGSGNQPVLFRIDLTALSATAAAPSVETPEGATPAAASPSQRHTAEKRFMLDLINAERAAAGVGTVTLGTNVAAQLHAESASADCFSSHWGMDGLGSGMRYALAGDYQRNAENVAGISYCVKVSDGYAPITDLESSMSQTVEVLMGSAAHRETLLDPHHRKVNIGLAWDRYSLTTVQQFEGDYFTFDRLPALTGNVLTLSGSTRNGAQWAPDLVPQIFFAPPPGDLTVGQLARTYCYDFGPEVAGLLEPAPPGYEYDIDQFELREYVPCPKPYDFRAGSPAPRSRAEARELWNFARMSPRPVLQSRSLWVKATEWRETGNSIRLTANLRDVLDENGAGVYTLVLWGLIGGEPVVVAQYPVFHGVTLPDTYGAG